MKTKIILILTTVMLLISQVMVLSCSKEDNDEPTKQNNSGKNNNSDNNNSNENLPTIADEIYDEYYNDPLGGKIPEYPYDLSDVLDEILTTDLSDFYISIEKLYDLRQKADNGDVEACVQVGYCYLEGIGYIANKAEAFKYFMEAAKQNNAKAQFYVGLLSENDETAIEWYEKAANNGYAPAYRALGYRYALNSDKTTYNYTVVVEWLQKAARTQGCGSALYDLGTFYEKGKGVIQDYSIAVDYYKSAALCDNGVRPNNSKRLAIQALIRCCTDGLGVKQNYAAAAQLEEKLSGNNNGAYTQFLWGTAYFLGSGVTQDCKKAFEYYKKSAEQDFNDALNAVGLCYKNGYGVVQNYSKAFEMFKKSADNGNAVGLSELGKSYLFGYGVSKDVDEAYKCFHKSAMQGNVDAYCNLGYCYDNGIGCVKNYQYAFEWFKKASLQGDATAQSNLGTLYYDGRGVNKNYYTAFEYYKRAANKGDDRAQYYLGLCYENGQGTTKDLAKAKEWYQKAADQGNEDAKKRLENM